MNIRRDNGTNVKRKAVPLRGRKSGTAFRFTLVSRLILVAGFCNCCSLVYGLNLNDNHGLNPY